MKRGEKVIRGVKVESRWGAGVGFIPPPLDFIGNPQAALDAVFLLLPILLAASLQKTPETQGPE